MTVCMLLASLSEMPRMMSTSQTCRGPIQPTGDKAHGICQGKLVLKSRDSSEDDRRMATNPTDVDRDDHYSVTLPGRLGDLNLTMLDDPRLDPRVRQMMSAMPAGGAATLPQVSLASSYDECLTWVAEMEALQDMQSDVMFQAMPDFSDIATQEKSLTGVDGNEIKLYIEKPKGRGCNASRYCPHPWWWDGVYD